MKLTENRISLLKLAIMLIAILIGIFGIGRFGSNTVDASASGPNPSNTDAPGEANCRACHVQFPLNSGAGSVSISGVPSKWNPGQQIPLTVTTSQADGVVYGFQMTAIDYLGRRAGTLTVVPSTPQQTQIANGVVGGNTRQYVSHTIDGILPTMFGSKSWNVTWTAPAQRIGSVSFYAAGNGSNSDGQTSGDYIYTTVRSGSSIASPFDFDGDAKTDVSIFRPGPGEWWVLRSSDGGNFATQFGSGTDVIVPVDFTGDGKTDIAIWRPSNGNWLDRKSVV